MTTSADAAQLTAVLAERLGTSIVRCADRAGDVVDAVVYGYVGDAVRMRAAGYADAHDIDQAMAFGCGFLDRSRCWRASAPVVMRGAVSQAGS